MIYDLGDRRVKTIGDAYYIAPNAAVVGRVTLGRDVSIWFNAVLRADSDTITIGDRSNVQDGAVLHLDEGAPVIVGEGVSIGHSATVHGCRVGSNSLIGIGATILSYATIGEQCLVGAGALVTEKKTFPDRSLIIGAPARRVRELTDEELSYIRYAADHYVELGKKYCKKLKVRSRN